MEQIKVNGESIINFDMDSSSQVDNKQEETISFKKDTERMMYGAVGYDGNELMAAITGYDLQVSFNMRLINSIADAESCANALADVFYQALMEQLIAQKPNVVQQTENG